jgi:cation:H+ antiporter
VLNPFIHWVEARGSVAPWLFLALFLVASFLMLWRLEALSAAGFEGTVLGTLVMPYCSGMGNLIFAFILGRSPNGNGTDVMTNSLVNNVTNMTLVLGLPALIWGMNLVPKAKPDAAKKKAKGGGRPHELNRLSLLLTLLAVLFFTGVVWAMGRKGSLDSSDGLVLVGMFLFWQFFHVFEVLKQSERQGKSAVGWMFPVDIALLAVGAYGIYVSTDWLVGWVSNSYSGFISVKHLGWLSGWLMVLPNAVMALYYGLRKQPEIVYASQVGDAHVSIPLCLGVYCLYHTMPLPPFFHMSMFILVIAALVHFFFVGLFGRLPRAVGAILVSAYAVFLWKGLMGF